MMLLSLYVPPVFQRARHADYGGNAWFVEPFRARRIVVLPFVLRALSSLLLISALSEFFTFSFIPFSPPAMFDTASFFFSFVLPSPFFFFYVKSGESRMFCV